MLNLVEGRSLEVVLDDDPAQPLTFLVNYGDKGAAYAQDAVTGEAATAAATTLAIGVAGASRALNDLSIFNSNAVTRTLTFRWNDGATVAPFKRAVLAQNESVHFANGAGWYVCTADGSRKSGAVQDLSGYLTIIAAAAAYQPLFAFADSQTPTGSVNGSNVTFTLAAAPSPAASLMLFRNGVLQTAGSDYTLSTDTITYTTAPSTGDSHVCWFRH